MVKRMEPLAWFAATPEGEQLGRIAAQTVRVELTPLPFWFAPLEPLRWLIVLASAAPHAKVIGMTFAALSLLAGFIALWRYRSVSWGGLFVSIAVALNTMLTLSGLYLAMGWLITVIPSGMRWVVPDNAPFLLANFHTHTQASSGFLTPEQAVLWHLRKGYRVVAVTDSNTVRGGVRAATFAKRHRLPITVIIGEEFRGATHLALLNIRQDLSPRHFDVPAAIHEAKRQGGIVIAAHAWSGRNDYADLIAWGVDGFEVTNGTTLGDQRMLRLCQHHGLAAVGSLDFRAGNRPNTATVLPKWATTPERVLKALQNGKCAALYFPDRVGTPKFSLLEAWCNSASDMWQEGKSTTLLGFMLWGLIGIWWQRKSRHPATSSLRHYRSTAPSPSLYHLAAIILLFTFTVALGVWAMAWNLKRGWYPQLELVLFVWCFTCPLSWWLWRKGLFCYPELKVKVLKASGQVNR